MQAISVIHTGPQGHRAAASAFCAGYQTRQRSSADPAAPAPRSSPRRAGSKPAPAPAQPGGAQSGFEAGCAHNPERGAALCQPQNSENSGQVSPRNMQ